MGLVVSGVAECGSVDDGEGVGICGCRCGRNERDNPGDYCQGPSTPQPGAQKASAREKPGRFGRDDRFGLAARSAKISEMTKIGKITKSAKTAEITKIAEISENAKITKITKIAEISTAPINWVELLGRDYGGC